MAETTKTPEISADLRIAAEAGENGGHTIFVIDTCGDDCYILVKVSKRKMKGNHFSIHYVSDAMMFFNFEKEVTG